MKSKFDVLARQSDRSLVRSTPSVDSPIEQPLVRGAREPAVILMPDGSVRLALMQHMTELGDVGHE